MIVIKRNCSSSIKDNLTDQKFTFGDFTIRFEEEEYRAITDLISDTNDNPVMVLQAIIEEGLWSLMQPE